MCGRYALSGDRDFYADYYQADEVAAESLDASWNVAPTDPVYVVAEHRERATTEAEGGGSGAGVVRVKRMLGTMSWGLLPHWAKDRRGISINARAETVATKPAFRDAFSRHRCLIPADGFYEWAPKDKGRTPHWVYRADGHPMSFAGIWAARKDDDSGGWLRTCAIITTKAEGVVADIHDRMPVALAEDTWDAWLSRDIIDTGEAMTLLRPKDPDLIMEHEVSSEVNNVRNNGRHLPDPV